MKNPIQTYEANTKGRDFVIGDLHGSFTVFLNLLDKLGFDPAIDRMFSGGDLVDRGPDSLSCLRLLDEPWFKCVLANHEQMMYEAFTDGRTGPYWMPNGGYWAAEYMKNICSPIGTELTPDAADLVRLVEMVEELPYLITVKLLNGERVHVIHAELPPNWVVSDVLLENPEKVREMAQQQTMDGDVFVWGRWRFYNFCRLDVSNHEKNVRKVAYMEKTSPKNESLSRIVSGHTVVHKPLAILNQTNIDTGAYESYPDHHGKPQRSWAALTCIELNTWKFYQATEDTFREVEPEVINRAEIDAFKDGQNG